MVVRSNSPKAIANQKQVMEYLLINHPLDCPVCDQAGECLLQDYSYQYGRSQSRFEEDKAKKAGESRTRCLLTTIAPSCARGACLPRESPAGRALRRWARVRRRSISFPASRWITNFRATSSISARWAAARQGFPSARLAAEGAVDLAGDAGGKHLAGAE
jgi:hypothetical protein